MDSLVCLGKKSKAHGDHFWAPRNLVPVHVVTPKAMRNQVERTSVKSPSSSRFWGTTRTRWSSSGNTLTPKACLVLLVQRPSKAAKTIPCRHSSMFRSEVSHTLWIKDPLDRQSGVLIRPYQCKDSMLIFWAYWLSTIASSTQWFPYGKSLRFLFSI